MIFENQTYRHGSLKEETKRIVEKNLLEMYFPSEQKWKDKALADCSQAFSGILRAEGYLK
jgi:hypothetical protein